MQAKRAIRADTVFRIGEVVDEMQSSVVPHAVTAAMSIASSLDLTVDDAIVLHNSNKLALRLLPCDVLARVAPRRTQVAQFEVDLAHAARRSPAALWPLSSPEWSRASTNATASRSRCGPTTNP